MYPCTWGKFPPNLLISPVTFLIFSKLAGYPHIIVTGDFVSNNIVVYIVILFIEVVYIEMATVKNEQFSLAWARRLPSPRRELIGLSLLCQSVACSLIELGFIKGLLLLLLFIINGLLSLFSVDVFPLSLVVFMSLLL